MERSTIFSLWDDINTVVEVFFIMFFAPVKKTMDRASCYAGHICRLTRLLPKNFFLALRCFDINGSTFKVTVINGGCFSARLIRYFVRSLAPFLHVSY